MPVASFNGDPQGTVSKEKWEGDWCVKSDFIRRSNEATESISTELNQQNELTDMVNWERDEYQDLKDQSEEAKQRISEAKERVKANKVLVNGFIETAMNFNETIQDARSEIDYLEEEVRHLQVQEKWFLGLDQRLASMEADVKEVKKLWNEWEMERSLFLSLSHI